MEIELQNGDLKRQLEAHTKMMEVKEKNQKQATAIVELHQTESLKHGKGVLSEM